MPLDREAQAVLDSLAASPSGHPGGTVGSMEWASLMRDRMLQMIPLAGEPAAAECVQHQMDGTDGPLNIRAYRSAAGILPALLFFHGGGFVAGSLDTHDAPLRSLAAATGTAVIAVDYRRAPEHPFPAAPEDCYTLAAHVAGSPEPFGVDPARLVVAGDSAGGLLAAAVALMARDRGGPALAGQICLYPHTDLRPHRAYPSMAEHDGAVVSLADTARNIELYLAGADPTHPYASPVMASSHAGLPPALVVTCEYDVLRDEGAAYAQRLRDAGVVVEHLQLPAMIHGVLQMGGRLGATRALMASVGQWVSRLATLGANPR